MTLLALDSVTKRFGSVTAVDGVALSVARGGAALDGRRLLALCRTAVGESAEALTVREAQTLAWPQRHSEGTGAIPGAENEEPSHESLGSFWRGGNRWRASRKCGMKLMIG